MKMDTISAIILEAAKKAKRDTKDATSSRKVMSSGWPIKCTIGPGLEGAIACDSKVGYVNGSKGALIYRGYDILDLCVHSNYEEVCYLLIHGELPTQEEFSDFNEKLKDYRSVNSTLRKLMGFPVEEMGAMSALRLGTNFMRHEMTQLDKRGFKPKGVATISADEDSIPMETPPTGEKSAKYEFKRQKRRKPSSDEASGVEACYHLIAGVATIAAAISRLQRGLLPVEPDPELSHSANLLYMINGKRPSYDDERIMDVALILHADHGMNASTFASMVVASTLSDFYFSVGSGIAALNGPLHGGANEEVIRVLDKVMDYDGTPEQWVAEELSKKAKIPGFGHRVYKTYDPRARVLGPLAEHLVKSHPDEKPIFAAAKRVEKKVVATLGKEKKIFPNVDYYSGIIYRCLGRAPEMYTPIFAVSRVAGWTARMLEYGANNRIFRPRARYTGHFDREYEPFKKRS